MNAIEKINAELKTAKLSRAGKVVSKSVVDTLAMFCVQNEEFAQAIEQSGKAIGECIEHTIKGCGGAVSDIEVYRKAVEFYFSGATVHFNMTIDLGDNGFSNKPVTDEDKPAPKTSLQLSLDDLLM